MQPEARALAETLLAVTLSASAQVEDGDWESAGHLLRRREQLLTQIEACPDAVDAIDILRKVQDAERALSAKMEAATRDVVGEMETARDLRTARHTYRHSGATGGLIERIG